MVVADIHDRLFFVNVLVRCVVFNNRGVGGEELLVSTRNLEQLHTFQKHKTLSNNAAYVPLSPEMAHIYCSAAAPVYLWVCTLSFASLSSCVIVLVFLLRFVKPAKCFRQQGFSYDLGARRKSQNWCKTEDAFCCSLHQTPVTYCASDTSDLERVVQHVKALYADAPVLGAGVSLGGWVGEQLHIPGKILSSLHGFLF